MEAYLREIARTPLLTRDEERALAARINGGDEADALAARNHLVAANLRLVVGIARKYQGHGLEMADLIAYGNFGLFVAAKRYKPFAYSKKLKKTVPVRFSTYATWWVRQAVGYALDNYGRTVRIPAYLAEVIGKWLQAGMPKGEELLGLMPASWRHRLRGQAMRDRRAAKASELMQNARRAIMAGPFPFADQDEEHGLEPASRTPDPCEHAAAKDDRESLAGGLVRLEKEDSRAALILRLRFGLGGGQPPTLKEIGEHLGLTRERVRQIEGQALCRLRAIMGVDVPVECLSYYERKLSIKAAAARARRARRKTAAG